MRNASGKVKMSGSEKVKANMNTGSKICGKTRKFYSRAKQEQRKSKKRAACTNLFSFLLIRKKCAAHANFFFLLIRSIRSRLIY